MTFTYKEKRHVWGLQDKENGYLFCRTYNLNPLDSRALLIKTRKGARSVKRTLRNSERYSVVKIYLSYEIHAQ